ncbi:MAG TPA: DUF3606 domain-containing protein [Burkholderiales bacterium]|nr:DUF3606 domain-containing protein [Burkholderiales bacterium]
MSTKLGGPGGADRPRIYLDEEWERVYWSETFGVSADGLERVLREIGDDAADVKRYFAAQRAAGERRKA